MPQDTPPAPSVTPWKAPLAVSLVGLLIFALEYAWLWRSASGGLETIMIFAGVLFAIGWALPPRPSLHGLRMGLLSSALVISTVPLVLVLLLGLAMSAG
ncbi:hypothetical protein [Streptomyces buecherae]|uniref:hypothetical protein n=1 Tax=Streptomyces buecherae TaxID=2763006 RepID=UPI003673DE9C